MEPRRRLCEERKEEAALLVGLSALAAADLPVVSKVIQKKKQLQIMVIIVLLLTLLMCKFREYHFDTEKKIFACSFQA